VDLWEVLTGKRRAMLRGPRQTLLAVAFRLGGEMLATGEDDGAALLWQIRGEKVRATPGAGLGFVCSAAISPDKKLRASGDYQGVVRLRANDTSEVRALLRGHSEMVFSVAFSPDGRALASGGLDGTVRLWNVGTGREMKRFRPHDVIVSVTFRSDGRTLAAGSPDGTVWIWDITSGNQQESFCWQTGLKIPRCNRCLRWSPDGKLLAACGGSHSVDGRQGEVWLRDLRGRNQVATLKGHTNPVVSLAFCPDSRLLASGGLDGTIRLWDVPALLKSAK
jgi:WD40 repeat protein